MKLTCSLELYRFDENVGDDLNVLDLLVDDLFLDDDEVNDGKNNDDDFFHFYSSYELDI